MTIDNPVPGERVLFEVNGLTLSGHIAAVDAKGQFRIDPDRTLEGPIQFENLRRVNPADVLTDDERTALRIKHDGRYASTLYQNHRAAYDAAMALIRTGRFDRVKHKR